MKRPTLTLKQQQALQPVQPQAEIVLPPKPPTYQELEQRAYAMGLVKLEENAPTWRRLRRSAGFAD